MPPIRVGVVTTSYPLTIDSPSGTFVERFVRALPSWVQTTVITPDAAEIGWNPAHGPTRVLTFRYAPKRWQVLCHAAGGLPARLMRQPWLYALVPVLLLAMLRMCVRQRREIDIYHANWSVNGVVAAIAARIAGKPVITTPRGSDVNLARNSVVYRVLLSTCLRLNDRVVAVSETLRGTILALAPKTPPGRVIAVPNGIDDSFFAIPRAEAPHAPLRLVTVGSLTPNKSVDVLLRAVASLPRAQTRLQIVGDGPDRLRLQGLASNLALGDRVDFLGAVPSDRVPSILANADVFLLASRSEGRPNSVMEALAAGLPVIASDIGGLREVMENGIHGYLVPPGNHAEFAQRIQDLCENPGLCLSMGEAARAHVRAKHLTWEGTAGRYAELYRSLLGHTNNS